MRVEHRDSRRVLRAVTAEPLNGVRRLTHQLDNLTNMVQNPPIQCGG